mmetsp:Transcript_27030/g.46907  ORF Transcript_27030/g.46907 Transcript_27030/m.46907 type:complete len:175 (+) Transcript_27030:161-685(+)
MSRSVQGPKHLSVWYPCHVPSKHPTTKLGPHSPQQHSSPYWQEPWNGVQLSPTSGSCAGQLDGVDVVFDDVVMNSEVAVVVVASSFCVVVMVLALVPALVAVAVLLTVVVVVMVVVVALAVIVVVVVSCLTVTGSATHISSNFPHSARNVADESVVPVQPCEDFVTLLWWSTTF